MSHSTSLRWTRACKWMNHENMFFMPLSKCLAMIRSHKPTEPYRKWRRRKGLSTAVDVDFCRPELGRSLMEPMCWTRRWRRKKTYNVYKQYILRNTCLSETYLRFVLIDIRQLRKNQIWYQRFHCVSDSFTL